MVQCITPDTPNENGNTDDVFVHSSALKAAGIRFLNENDIVEFDEEVRNDKLSVTTLKLIHRDEESARRFQERRAERRRAIEDRKQRAEKSERRSGFAFIIFIDKKSPPIRAVFCYAHAPQNDKMLKCANKK